LVVLDPDPPREAPPINISLELYVLCPEINREQTSEWLGLI
jgi:hypothetical protein